MRHHGLLAGLTGSLLFLPFIGCSDLLSPPDSPLAHAEAALTVGVDGDGLCTPLIAGQHIDAGTVCVAIDDGDHLTVTYATTGGWEIVEAHLWVGTDLADMPQTRTGNPRVGLFPHATGDIAGATSYSFTIDLAAFGIRQADCPEVTPALLYVAAHAALQRPTANGGFQTETGWGFGERFVQRGNWGTYFTVQIACSDNGGDPPDARCETAFARSTTDATCFHQLGFANWGWTNGPLTEGSYRFELWAAAGLCDVSKGYLVGYADVDYADGVAYLSLVAASGFGFDEAHYYVGTETLPRTAAGRITTAPGQYPVVTELDYQTVTADDATFTGLLGSIHVIVHAVVCGDYPGDGPAPPELY